MQVLPGLVKSWNCWAFLITFELLRKVLDGKTAAEQDTNELMDFLRVVLAAPT